MSNSPSAEDRVYDERLNRLVTDDDLPGDLTVANLRGFLVAHQASFCSLESLTGDGSFKQDDRMFRVGVDAGHIGSGAQRGVNVLWETVRAWLQDAHIRKRGVALANRIMDVMAIQTSGTFEIEGQKYEVTAEDHNDGTVTFECVPGKWAFDAGHQTRLFRVRIEEVK